ncbi:MAG: OsmC family protein [Firmicutes bacterium]|nr:OsmC family protein [Bacillota bacterium]
MEMKVTFPGGKRVSASFKGFVVETDQPEAAGGGNTAPSPFDLFLASIGTCAGYYALSFCLERGIPHEGVELLLRTERDRETGLIGRIEIAIRLPGGFPEEYREAVIRAASACTVKKHLTRPPEIFIYAEKKV